MPANHFTTARLARSGVELVSNRGKVYRNGRLIFSDVEIELKLDSAGPGLPRSWHGRFSVPKRAAVKVGEEYQLLLNDGTSIRGIVQSVKAMPSGGFTAQFRW